MERDADLYRRLLEIAPDAIVGVTQDGLIVLVNRQAEVLFGYERDEMIGRPIEILVPESARGIHPHHRDGYFRHPGTRPMGAELELAGLRRDGTEFPAEISLSAIETDDGLLVSAAIRDVSSRKAAEARFRGLLEAAPDAIVGVTQDGLIALVNGQTEVLFGYERSELIGQPVEILVPDAARGVHPGHRDGYFANPTTRPMGAGMDLAGRRKDGTEFPAEISLSSIDTSGGQLVSAAIRDGTERREAAIVSSTADAVFAKDLQGRITSWNPGATALFGYQRSEIIGRDMNELIPDELLAERADLVARVTGGDPVSEYETTMVRSDRSHVHVVTTMSPIRDPSGAIIGISSIARDITERTRVQRDREALEARLRQSERLESLGQLAGGVAHDFNNLLSVILNYANFTIEAVDDDAVREDIEEIRSAAERAARLTHQLLLFGRRETTQLETLDLNAVVADVHSLLSRTIGEHVELVVRPSSSAPVTTADRGQMEQILLNLAVNARDAMPNGGTLTIETTIMSLDGDGAMLHPGLAPGRYVQLSVSDTGSGMAQDTIDHAFEPFFTTKPKGEGTGLGLATVYGIVTEAGGHVTIYSEIGMGTTVRVYLRPADEPSSRGHTERPPLAQGGGETILLVEDEDAIRKVTARILTRNGYDVVAAAGGTEALELARTTTFAMVLTDVVMPQMSGRDLAEQLAVGHPSVPVLFMSGYSQGVLGPQSGLEDGVTLIQKPFTEQSLVEKVQEVLRSARPPVEETGR